MKKLLVICGPTATGKTKLATYLARKFSGEVVSADSRQVYREMDIGTGKNLPFGANIKYPWFYGLGYYEIDGVKIWGYDLADPKKDFSVAQYVRFADRIIADVSKRNNLAILTGGTGFYIKGVIDRIPTAQIPRNSGLRKNLSGKTAEELYEMLSQIDSIKAGSLNSSDKKNPRRLIRAIEVATWMIDNRRKMEKVGKKENFDILFIGLSSLKENLERRVDENVETRVEAGIKEEIRKLLKLGVKWDFQAMMSLGYRQYRDYFEGGAPESAVVDEWKREEKRYVKRQLVWFRKENKINWFDITEPGFEKKVEKMVKRWHNQGDHVSEN